MKNTGLLESLDRVSAQETREKRQRDTRRKLGRQIFSDLLTLMPATLGQLFRAERLATAEKYNSGGALGSVRINLSPTGNLANPSVLKRTMGTITKVADALEKHGWEIMERGTVDVSEYNPRAGMYVTVGAARELVQRGKPHNVHLSFVFDHIPETDTCKLVKKEVIVAAVGEHKEERYVVKCEEPVS